MTDMHGAAASDAARLMQAAGKAALATLDAATGHPYASLGKVALAPDGCPILLLSRLARHTRNIDRDSRASLLFEPAGLVDGDPLAAARGTVLGQIVALSPDTVDHAVAKATFLARHPDAAGYAEFADFRFFKLAIAGAHFIGGFGRIVEISAADLANQARTATQ